MPDLQRKLQFNNGLSLDQIKSAPSAIDNQYFSVLKSVKIMPDISDEGCLRPTLFDRPLFFYLFNRFFEAFSNHPADRIRKSDYT